jgi:hypothetical protein
MVKDTTKVHFLRANDLISTNTHEPLVVRTLYLTAYGTLFQLPSTITFINVLHTSGLYYSHSTPYTIRVLLPCGR